MGAVSHSLLLTVWWVDYLAENDTISGYSDAVRILFWFGNVLQGMADVT